MQYVENNQEKYDTYLVLYNKLKHAMTREFYLESILITYAIFEDRSKSILAHLAIYDEKKHRDLARKIVSINNLIEQKHKIVSKYLNPDIIENIGVWRQKRNKIIHGLANLKYDDEEIKKIATDGYELVKKFSNATTSIRRKVESAKK
jgi:hypothetical protein